MPIVALKELKAGLGRGKCLLGIDLGSTTIGLAVSDATRIIASPLETLKRGKFRVDSAALVKLIEQRDIGGIVIGLPVSMDGTEGPRCQATRQFAENLLGVIDLPIAFWDERLSTAAVERVLIGEADMSRKRRREVVDKMAAAYILQGALDTSA
jgi:putative Holliday junction resolvase